jgi:transposase
MRDFVARQQSVIQLEYLPAYAPKLNPVEHISGHLKRHEVVNFCPSMAVC